MEVWTARKDGKSGKKNEDKRGSCDEEKMESSFDFDGNDSSHYAALTACGGYQIETGSVSGGAVSGQAMSEKSEETGRFCNDTHLYY